MVHIWHAHLSINMELNINCIIYYWMVRISKQLLLQDKKNKAKALPLFIKGN